MAKLIGLVGSEECGAIREPTSVPTLEPTLVGSAVSLRWELRCATGQVVYKGRQIPIKMDSHIQSHVLPV